MLGTFHTWALHAIHDSSAWFEMYSTASGPSVSYNGTETIE